MTDTPVSVVIPAFNAAATVEQALASVALQSILPTAVVVVDDCSDDNTAELAGRWSGRLPLQVTRLTRNSGPAAARRAAIDMAGGELIALLDADDVWFPDHLESLVRTHRRNGGIASADALRWYPGRGVHRGTHRDHLPIPPSERQLREVFTRNFVAIGALFPHAAYQAAGGFRDGYSGAEDWDLWIRMIRAGLRVHPAPGVTMLYRVTAGGLTHRTDILDTYVRVLEAAADEAVDAAELAWARHGLRRMQARRRLAAAYGHARSGDGRQARAAAMTCIGSGGRTALEAGLILASPGLVTRGRDVVARRRW